MKKARVIGLIVFIVIILICGVVATLLITKSLNADNKLQGSNNTNQEKVYSEWTQLDNYTVVKGTTVLKIGDMVDYNDKSGGFQNGVFTEKYNGNWQVLGAENGNLLIISASPVDYFRLGDYSNLAISQESYVNSINSLNSLCEIYGTGEGAVGVRSVNIEDINRLTKYIPENNQNSTINSHLNNITFYWDESTYPYYTSTNGASGNLSASHLKFIWYDGNNWNSVDKDVSSSEEQKVKVTSITNTSYNYQLSDSSLKDVNDNIYNMINVNSWLATHAVETSDYWVGYGLFAINEGRITDLSCVYSNGGVNSYQEGVRAVVMISGNATLEGTSDDGWKISMQNSDNTSSINWGGNSLNIGDKVEYNDKAGENGEEKYKGDWKVLGIDNGKLLIVSAKSVERKKLPESNDLIGAQDVYLNGAKYLNEVCSKYGTGKGATSARSINLEDINKLTGYDVREDLSNKNKYEEYGNSIYFYWDTDDKPCYNSSNASSGGMATKHSKFIWYDGSAWQNITKKTNSPNATNASDNNKIQISAKDNIKATITNSSQSYSLQNLTSLNTLNNDLILAYNDPTSIGYWLATPSSHFSGSAGYYGMHYVGYGSVGAQALLSTNGSVYTTERAVIAVVELSSDIKLVGTSETGWIIQ